MLIVRILTNREVKLRSTRRSSRDPSDIKGGGHRMVVEIVEIPSVEGAQRAGLIRRRVDTRPRGTKICASIHGQLITPLRD